MSDFNSLANKDQVLDTPSRSDGIPEHIEDTLRLYGCQSIQQAGILLGLPQVAMATAQVLFHRFWYVSSMRNFGVRDMSMGSLLLASKLEEVQVHIRDLVNVFDFMSQWRLHNEKDRPPAKRPAEMSDFRYAPMGSYSEKYYDIKDAVLAAEMQLLKRLGFNVYVSLPHALMINYLQVLGLADSELQPKGGQGKFNASQCAWNYLNDACVVADLSSNASLLPISITCDRMRFNLYAHASRQRILLV